MQHQITIVLHGEKYNVTLAPGTYHNGPTSIHAIDADTGEAFCCVSVNLPESTLLPKGEFYVKHWSENSPIIPQLVAQGVIVPVQAPLTSSGFVDNIRAYRLG